MSARSREEQEVLELEEEENRTGNGSIFFRPYLF
jgi:hypothetical protein